MLPGRQLEGLAELCKQLSCHIDEAYVSLLHTVLSPFFGIESKIEVALSLVNVSES